MPNSTIHARVGLSGRILYTVPVSVAIAERKRRAVRGELSEVALQLLANRAFDSLTIDEIAAAAGVSRRTFFREHLRIAVVNALATRLGMDAERDMRPQILATIAFAPLDAAMFAWFGNRSGEEVGRLLDEALGTFERERDAMCAGLRSSMKLRTRPRSA